MKKFFVLFIAYLIVERLFEWKISYRNEKWMDENSSIVFRTNRYKIYVYLSSLFIFMFIAEIFYKKFSFPKFNLILFIIFLITQVLRVWSINVQGKFWSKKEVTLPKITYMRKGLYKYFRRPLDLIRGIEFIVISFMFGAYVTVSLFPLCYMVVLISLALADEGIIKMKAIE